MDGHLRDRFEQATAGDPGAPPGELALAAITEGGRIRRRRHRLVAAGVAAGLVLAAGGLTAANLPWGAADRTATPPVTIAAAMVPVSAPSCSQSPVEDHATDLAVFLATEATDRQRDAVAAAVRDDARVDAVVFESRAEAYQRFATLWADSPDFVAAINADDLPESFRLRLTDPEHDAALRARFAAMPGVAQILGHRCPTDAPVGGLR
ncbi:permease-like cell division protein FtsX [Actinoplanes xinjiangensis]|uniref:FtsX extracellular domain-containing protein n=1 Tax=Actinoplanes xinjiangensis TaxID=512350 RepID=A0A316FH78_9ACTN|nr:permease-like cell division protein FtsX [Actinoplanes xinjiangensis]PWK47593.1 hypothetical protein BC793_107203 [Actinoplanes xinjiangensis]GIF39478.1 hypothetical protein Axi01nite_37890 [Actinoplanes xinjiangensis]